jgi:S1-C subfamily serine protease
MGQRGKGHFRRPVGAACLVFALALLAAGPPAAAATIADPGTVRIATKTVGKWTAYAFGFADGGAFSHCAAAFDHGILGTISVSMDASRWSLGFSHPSWSLAVSCRALPVLLSIDDGPQRQLTATARSPNTVTIGMPLDQKLVTAFRNGRSIEVSINQSWLTIDISGAGAVMAELDSCVSFYTGKNSVASGSGSEPPNGAGIATAANSPPAKAPASGTGTGLVVTATGHVVTNNHVIDVCKTITVAQVGEPPISATLVARDKTNDLALLKVTMDIADADVARLRIGRPVPPGEKIAVFGFPLAGALSTSGNIVEGNIAAVSGLGNDTSHFQISAPLQPGNSGGPLLDFTGTIVGVTDSSIDDLRVAGIVGALPQNVNFAIKATVLANFLEAQSVSYAVAPAGGTAMDLVAVAAAAKRFTVLVSCRN